jgi:serine kinase of HPr protein (carbohydrate metabolism regulator)
MTAPAPAMLHAGLIALRMEGEWRGVLIEGPAGSGKSDLALRALSHGFQLVADDRTVVFVSAGRLYGRAPDALAGLIEVRGLGVVSERALPMAEIALALTCENAPEAVDRMPDFAAHELLGLSVPMLRLWPFEPAAPAKLRRALEHLGQRGQQAYQASLAPPERRLGATL